MVTHLYQVSTHSRLKAAGIDYRITMIFILCFNTQPPEGGWILFNSLKEKHHGFNTQPPEGGWNIVQIKFDMIFWVSTHSRLKAAG